MTDEERLESWARLITVRDVNREAHLPTAIEQLRQFRDAIIKEERAKSVSVEPYPETVRMARLIYERMPSSDDPDEVRNDDVPSWEELSHKARANFIRHARNLGAVFPEQYPKLAEEGKRFVADAYREAMENGAYGPI